MKLPPRTVVIQEVCEKEFIDLLAHEALHCFRLAVGGDKRKTVRIKEKARICRFLFSRSLFP